MPDSDFVFEEGDPITVGSHGQHDFVFADGEPVLDGGESSLVFEGGTGLGRVGVSLYVDDSLVGTVQPIDGSGYTASEFYNYGGGFEDSSAADPWYDYLALHDVSVAIVECDGGVYYFHTYSAVGDVGGTVDVSLSGTEGGVVVEDDPETPSNYDSYSLTACQNSWDPVATDGFVIGPFSDGSKAVEMDFTRWETDLTHVSLEGESSPARQAISGSETLRIEFSV